MSPELWQGRLVSRSLQLVGVGVLAIGFGAALLTRMWWPQLTSFAGALLVWALAAIDVIVDARGLTVRSSFGRFAWKRIPAERIVHVEAIGIEPLRWGGWGYRLIKRGSAVVLRRGPGLRIDLVDGRVFAVTIDDPEPAAALLNDLAGRHPH